MQCRNIPEYVFKYKVFNDATVCIPRKATQQMLVDPVLYGFFIVATVLFIITPGPIVSLIIGQTLQEGLRSGIAVSLGAGLVSLGYLAVYLLGFASLMTLSAETLAGLRYAGAAYLFWLAWQAWNRKPALNANTISDIAAATQEHHSAWASFRKSVLVALTSPKMILFFAAFFPQFMTDSLPLQPQILALSATFMVIALSIDIGWAVTANKAKLLLTQRNKLQLVNKVSGGVLAVGASLLLFLNP